MALVAAKVLLYFTSLGNTFSFRSSTSRARLSTLEERISILPNFSSTDLLKQFAYR
jgi:hypothetical protein